MPIVVSCPGCGTRLNAPDAAAGKRVRCPKPDCGTAVPVPAPVAVEEEPPAPVEVSDLPDDDAPRRPAKKAARARADDEDDDRPRKKARRRDEDEDDDDDDRPARRKKPKGGGTSPAVIGAAALAALLVLGGVGYGIYALAFKKKEETAGPAAENRPDVLAGWTDYRSDRDKFKIRVPKPMAMRTTAGGQREYKSEDQTSGLVNVLVAEIKPGTPAGLDLRKMMEAGIVQTYKNSKKFKNVTEREVEYLGQTVTEVSIETPSATGPDVGGLKGKVTVRVVGFEKHVYVIMVGGTEATMPNANVVFDTFEYLK